MIRVLAFLHTRLVRLLPSEFGAEYGDEMQRTFGERVAARARSRGTWSALLEGALGCVDAARVVVRQRAAGRLRWSVSGGAARDALRSVRRSPGWSLMLVVILGIGIGATTAMFSVVTATVLRPLPYPDADALVRIGSVREGRPQLGSVSLPNFRDLERSTVAFSSVAASTVAPMAIPTPEGPAGMVRGGFVSGAFFDVLGVPPHLGRTLTPADDRAESLPAVVLSHTFWQTRFGGRRAIVGESLRINGRDFVVAGVMGPEFLPPEGVRLGGRARGSNRRTSPRCGSACIR